METPYRAVAWRDGDVVTKDQIEQVQSNLTWLKENTPRGRIYTGGGFTPNKTAIACGLIWFKPNTAADRAHADVRFGSLFKAGHIPSVTTGLSADFNTMIFNTVEGLGRRPHPTRDGFTVRVLVKAPNKKAGNRIKRSIIVHWTAMGVGV